jgi:predicted thioesterase
MEGAEEIGRGTHGRIVINMAKFSERLAVKEAREPGSTS